MNEQEKADFLKERRGKNIVLVVVLVGFVVLLYATFVIRAGAL